MPKKPDTTFVDDYYAQSTPSAPAEGEETSKGIKLKIKAKKAKSPEDTPTPEPTHAAAPTSPPSKTPSAPVAPKPAISFAPAPVATTASSSDRPSAVFHRDGGGERRDNNRDNNGRRDRDGNPPRRDDRRGGDDRRSGGDRGNNDRRGSGERRDNNRDNNNGRRDRDGTPPRRDEYRRPSQPLYPSKPLSAPDSFSPIPLTSSSDAPAIRIHAKKTPGISFSAPTAPKIERRPSPFDEHDERVMGEEESIFSSDPTYVPRLPDNMRPPTSADMPPRRRERERPPRGSSLSQ